MEIGQLKHRVELINVQRTQTAAGGQTRSDRVEATVWGNVSQVSWSQKNAAATREQRVTHKITIRYNQRFANGFGPEARARFKHRGAVRELAIKTVIDPDMRGNWLELGCEEGGPL